MRTGLALALVALMSATARLQDEDPGPDPRICPKLNRCKSNETKDKIKCPDCEKRSIYADYALCTTCARKRDVCSRCGRPKDPPKDYGAKATGKIEDAVESVKAANIREFLTVYSSDEFEGRCSTTRGNEKACEWLRDNIKEFGWEPGNKGEWYFPFDVSSGKTQNVLGILEGRDPKLKDEVVIFAAHLDHVGIKGGPMARAQRGGGDDVWNGADDNGSGTCTILEVARALGQTGIRAKRSIVVIFLNAEEWGLVGATKYCENPTYPLGNTAAVINLDMVGRNPDKPYSIGATGAQARWQEMIDEANRGVGAQFRVSNGPISRTDQHVFANKGLASIGIFSGQHSDYHGALDHADKIAYEKTEKCAKLVLKLVYDLANTDRLPK